MIGYKKSKAIPILDLEFELKLNGNANDSSGNSYHGTASSMSWIDTVNGFQKQCANFNGSSSRIQYDSHVSTLKKVNNFTVNACFKMAISPITSNPCIISMSDDGSGGDNTGFRIYKATGTGQINIWTAIGASTSFVNSTTNEFNDNKWHNLVFRKSTAHGIQVWIDGILEIDDTSTNAKSDLLMKYNVGQIGCISDGSAGPGSSHSAYWWDGEIDLVRIYHRAIKEIEKDSLNDECFRDLGQDEGGYSNLFNDGIGYLDFNGDKRDLIQDIDIFTENAPTLTSDHLGVANSAYSFNGTSNYLRYQVPVISGKTNFSFICIVKFSSLANGQRVVEKNKSGGLSYVLEIQSGNLQVKFSTGTDEIASIPTSSLSTGVWYIITCTFEGGTTVKLFINGDLIDTDSSVGASLVGDDFDLWIGAGADSSELALEHCNCIVSTFISLERTLSDNEAKKFYDLLNSKSDIYQFLKTIPEYLGNKTELILNDKKDSSSNRYTFTETGSVTVSRIGPRTNQLYFDGSSDLKKTGEIISDDFSLYFKIKAPAQSNKGVMHQANNGSVNNGHLYIYSASDSSNKINVNGKTSTSVIFDDQWHEIYITAKVGGSIKVWIDGILEIDDSATPMTDIGEFAIGYYYTNGFRFTGYIADLIAVSGEMSLQEFLELHYKTYLPIYN